MMLKRTLKNRKSILKGLGATICALSLTLGLCFTYDQMMKRDEQYSTVESIAYNSSIVDANGETIEQQYISDLTPVEKKMGYGSLGIDQDPNKNPITVKVEDNWFSFEKGLFAHASSYLVYDLTNLSQYNYFVAFIGMNRTTSRGNGVTYHFYTSNDRRNWTEVGTGIKKLPGENATYVKVPLNGAKYIKLEINDNGANGNDHSVFADAKFVDKIENNFVLESVEEIDEEIKSIYGTSSNIDDSLAHTIMKRELVKRVGQYTLNSFYNASEENKATINWLFNDQVALRYYVLGGTPDGGSYYNSLTQLTRLYNAYKDDFKITTTTKYDTVLGDMYLRMAIALSLTHSQTVGLWMQAGVKVNQSDTLVRYQIYKNLHANNKFKVREDIDITKWFEHYNVEDMRFIMNNLIDDESILWLNEYVQSKIDAAPGSAWGLLTPHPYMAYVWPDYGNKIYYDPENYDYFNDLFAVGDKKLYDYDITRGTMDNKIYKVWMNFRNKFGTGAVCGGISKTGSNIRATHGIAATVIGQPGHAALLYYGEDSQGRGYWNIDNDVSGWTLSEKGERMLLGWGNASYSRGSYQVVYMTLAQEVLNDYENFEKAEEYIMLARAYANDPAKQEQLLRNAIAVQPINIDAWYDLIQLYNNSTSKTEDQYYALAEQLAESLKYFPLPMYQLTNLIKPKITSVQNLYKFNMLQARILNEAKNTPNNTATSYTVYQPSVTRVEANYLLGVADNSIASFSFDGINAGKIVLSNKFDNSGIRWDYSLDGKQTWTEVSFSGEQEHKLELTKEQIDSITSENDIYVHVVGVDYSEENVYKIDIREGSLPSELFANDLENRIVGVNLNTEWRYSESNNWTSYNVSSPDLTGDKKVQIRQAAMGTTLASAPSEIYTFTEDNQPDTRKYIPVSHLTIHGVSTEAVNNGGAAVKAIDGNYMTRWHSAWNGSDTQRFIIVKLDKPVYLSAVEFVPAGGGNGKIKDGTVYGSMDGENWEVLSSMQNLTYTNQANSIADAIANTKSFEIEDAKEVQYVKIVADKTNGNWFTAREFNFYQDISKNPHPTAGVAYSTTEPTNGKVVARLINPSTNITITNNDGLDTYVFEKNGEFTFEFVDEKGTTGQAVAKVDWIDSDIPDADVGYELDNNHKISISLDGITEDVYLLDKNDNPINFIEVGNKKVTSISYLDSNKNTYKTVYVDDSGNMTKISYVNTDTTVPSVATYITTLSKGEVTGEEYYDSEGNAVTVTEADKEKLRNLQRPLTDPLEYTFEQSGEYEFKLLDKANNIAYKSIKADYNESDTIIVSDITYDITRKTNKNVTATIHAYSFDNKGVKSDAVIVSGDSTHEFSENGKFTFQYKINSTANDIEEHEAEVNWIDKVAPTAEIEYTTLENGNVVAALVKVSEDILILNNSSNREYTFTKNGTFTFKFEDLAGNAGSVTATVNSIKDPTEPSEPTDPTPEEPTTPSEPECPENPSIPKDPEPVIPYNPYKPNNGGNVSNGNKDESSEPIKPNPDDEEDKKDDEEKPSKDEKPSNDEDKTEDKEEKSKSKTVLVLILVLLALITAGLYVKNKKNN